MDIKITLVVTLLLYSIIVSESIVCIVSVGWLQASLVLAFSKKTSG